MLTPHQRRLERVRQAMRQYGNTLLTKGAAPAGKRLLSSVRAKVPDACRWDRRSVATLS